MRERSIISYFVPLVLAILIFASNFLDTALFKFGDLNFAVWFVLSVFCFASGWYIDKSFGWTSGTKIVFAITGVTTVIGVSIVVFFREYFEASNFTVENVVLFSLRNVFLGSMGYFGMSITEVFSLQSEVASGREKLKFIEETIKDARKESDLVIREAQVKAQKVINDAESNAKNTLLRKERIEKELKEFVQIEKELIKKYEET